MTRESAIKNLEEGLRFETLARDACEEIMSFLKNKEDKDTVRLIRDDEIKHYGLVKELIRIINKY